jgi:hypothetical protein
VVIFMISGERVHHRSGVQRISEPKVCEAFRNGFGVAIEWWANHVSPTRHVIAILSGLQGSSAAIIGGASSVNVVANMAGFFIKFSNYKDCI